MRPFILTIKNTRYFYNAFRVPDGFSLQDANRAADATVDKKCGRIKSKKQESSSTFSPKFSERKFLLIVAACAVTAFNASETHESVPTERFNSTVVKRCGPTGQKKLSPLSPHPWGRGDRQEYKGVAVVQEFLTLRVVNIYLIYLLMVP